MAVTGHVRPRDKALLDAIEAVEPSEHAGPVWRVARAERDPCVCGRSGGRWDDGTFDVLYTALERDGAIAEMYFHLKRGQPVFPSRARFHLHRLDVALERALKLLDLQALASLGVDVGTWGRLSSESRAPE